MAVNATAQAGVIEELEGAALHDSSLDPQGSGPAFKVLKQLVSNWLTDAVQNHNRCAAQSPLLLQRYVCLQPSDPYQACSRYAGMFAGILWSLPWLCTLVLPNTANEH